MSDDVNFHSRWDKEIRWNGELPVFDGQKMLDDSLKKIVEKVTAIEVERLKWQAVAQMVSAAPAGTDISTPEKFRSAQTDAFVKLVQRADEAEEAYNTLTGLLKRRFPKSGSDYRVEDVLRENEILRAKLSEDKRTTDEWSEQEFPRFVKDVDIHVAMLANLTDPEERYQLRRLIMISLRDSLRNGRK